MNEKKCNCLLAVTVIPVFITVNCVYLNSWVGTRGKGSGAEDGSLICLEQSLRVSCSSTVWCHGVLRENLTAFKPRQQTSFLKKIKHFFQCSTPPTDLFDLSCYELLSIRHADIHFTYILKWCKMLLNVPYSFVPSVNGMVVTYHNILGIENFRERLA